jgi:hypothetical protein
MRKRLTINELVRRFPPVDVGGRSADRGFFYQHLYVLRLIKEICAGTIDEYVCELAGDFITWKNAANGRPLKITLVEIKSCADGLTRSRVTAAFAKLAAKAQEFAECFPGANVVCRLVYNEIRGSARQVATPLSSHNVAYESERFVSLALTAEELREELHFLDEIQEGVTQLLSRAEDDKRLIEALLAVTVPFHVHRPSFSKIAALSDPVPLGKLGLDRGEALNTLRGILSGILLAAGPEQRLKQSKAIESAKRAAIRYMGASRVVSLVGTTLEWSPFKTRTEAMSFAQTTAFISGEGVLPNFRFYRDKNKFALKFDLLGLDPLNKFHANQPAHHCRVALLRSFAKAVRKWTDCRLTITERFIEGRRRWFVRNAGSAVPEFVLAGPLGLTPFDMTKKLLPHNWQSGPPLAKALRLLYYGRLSKKGIFRTPIFCAAWNDNVVAQAADWLATQKYVQVSDFEKLITNLFRSEAQDWPIFVSNVETEFLSDLLFAGASTPLETLCALRPRAWQIDRGRDHDTIFYVRCDVNGAHSPVQVGLLPNGEKTFSALRYLRYGAERAFSRLDADEEVAKEIMVPGDRFARFVLLRRIEDLADVAWQVFAIAESAYSAWWQAIRIFDLREVEREAVPPLIQQEENLHEIMLCRRDTLHREVFTCLGITDIVHERLVCPNGYDFKRHLRNSGYPTFDSCLDLSITARDHNEREIRGYVRTVAEHPDGSIHFSVSPAERSGKALPEGGYFYLSDRGLDAIVQTDHAFFNDLLITYRDEYTDCSPARKAWQFVRPMVMEGVTDPVTSSTLWKGEPFSLKECDEDPVSRVSEQLLQRFERGRTWQILTGAPGTGKTRAVAELIDRYLERHCGRVYPPCRVLVVANTHWAIDNLVRMFCNGNEMTRITHRVVSPGRRHRLINEGAVDRQLLQRLDEDFARRVSPVLPEWKTGAIPSKALQGYRARLKRARDVCRQLAAASETDSHSSLIPSHADWRRSSGFVATPFARHLQRFASLADERLSSIQNYQVTEADSSVNSVPSDQLHLFASEVVAVTVDGLTRVPDIGFDLIVFEEASQLSLLGLLKVLSKVIRGQAAGSHLHLIFSGDPQQLPPFLQEPPNCVPRGRLRHSFKRGKEAPSLFASLCARHPDRVQTLMIQRRMHPEIATLVNNLFYTDQRWIILRNAQANSDKAVWWFDSGSESAELEAGGTSWLHRRELQIASDLMSQPGALIGTLLAITPYSAQVKRLEAVLAGEGSYRTIDGCQGIEADTVIISLVRFDSAFVIDWHRYNVALSRARKRLYILGDFSALKAAAADLGDKAPHLKGLVALFSKQGPFADRLVGSRSALGTPL